MRFVLVHGSWQDGRCWDEVAALLEARGHEVHAPTLPGNAPGADPTVTIGRTGLVGSCSTNGPGRGTACIRILSTYLDGLRATGRS